MADTTFDIVTSSAICRSGTSPAERRRAVRHRSHPGREEDGQVVAMIFAIILNFLDQPVDHLARGGLGVAAGLSFQASVAAECSGIVVAVGLLCRNGDGGGRLRHSRPGRDASGLWAARVEADPVIPAIDRVVLLVRVPDGDRCDRDLRRRAAKADWHTVFADPRQRVLFGIIQAFVAAAGYESLKNLSCASRCRWLLAMFVYLFVLLANQADPNFAPAAVWSFPGKQRLGLGNLCRLVQRRGGRMARTMITDSADFLLLFAQPHRYVDRHAVGFGGRHDDLGLARRLRGRGDAFGNNREPVRADRRGQHELDHAGTGSWCSSPSTIGRSTSSTSTQAGCRSRTCSTSWGGSGRRSIASARDRALAVPDVLNSYLHYATLLGNFFLADRRDPGVRLSDPEADAARRAGAVLDDGAPSPLGRVQPRRGGVGPCSVSCSTCSRRSGDLDPDRLHDQCSAASAIR